MGGELTVSEKSVSSLAPHALSPEFVTNTLLGLSGRLARVPEAFRGSPPPLLVERHFLLVGRRQINFTLISALFHRKWGVASNISTASNGDFVQ